MLVSELIQFFEQVAPFGSQESYDNSGLILGNPAWKVKGCLICLDSTEAIIDEAIKLGVNTIIAHHPILFRGIKSITGKNYVERSLIKAIKNDIAIIAIHTNLDNYRFGVNQKIGAILGLQNMKILAPSAGKLNKLVVFVPQSHLQLVSDAMFKAGAGHIGDYAECSFQQEGIGTFKPLEGSTPYSGNLGKRSENKEIKLETICTIHNTRQVIRAMKAAHPYEEVAYDCYALINENQYEGAGMIGELPAPIETVKFLKRIKDDFKSGCIRHTEICKQSIQRVAFCGGSGSFLLGKAIEQKADIFITGDFKYHEFFDADKQIIIADIGHYESEQFTKDLIHDVLKKNFTNFVVYLSKTNTNPVNYL
ncbi:MAG: Nif3-like dinuclear metal center hexameric protein [Crocinitomicaceae bacterium]|nr:Nif3-like dinuclear metal center hexameric protein [Crocinitomicaceae bacterium]